MIRRLIRRSKLTPNGLGNREGLRPPSGPHSHDAAVSRTRWSTVRERALVGGVDAFRAATAAPRTDYQDRRRRHSTGVRRRRFCASASARRTKTTSRAAAADVRVSSADRTPNARPDLGKRFSRPCRATMARTLRPLVAAFVLPCLVAGLSYDNTDRNGSSHGVAATSDAPTTSAYPTVWLADLFYEALRDFAVSKDLGNSACRRQTHMYVKHLENGSHWAAQSEYHSKRPVLRSFAHNASDFYPLPSNRRPKQPTPFLETVFSIILYLSII